MISRRRHQWTAGLAAVLGLLAGAGTAAAACATDGTALGVSRIVEIDTTNGPLYGAMSRAAREQSFLAPKEIVLTFDDGPVPWITRSILDTLDRFCTKATFFSVGEMALAYPDVVKEVVAHGHTLGSHTWSHPMNLKHLKLEKAVDQIDRGFAAVALAAGEPIAPFFRFPGLSDSGPLLQHLQTRGIAAFTVDVVSNDSYIRSADRLAERTIRETEANGGGILLFHDIKAATTKALPVILAELQKRGYTVVHMRPKAPLAPIAVYDEELAPKLAKKTPAPREAHQLLPAEDVLTILAPWTASEPEPAVTSLAPPARERMPAVSEVTEEPGAITERHRGRAKAAGGSKAETRRKRTEADSPNPFMRYD